MTHFKRSNCFTIVFHSSVVQKVVIYINDTRTFFFVSIILYPVAIDFEL